MSRHTLPICPTLGQVRVRMNHRGDAMDGTVSLIRVIQITVRDGQAPGRFWQTISTRVAGAVVGRHRALTGPWDMASWMVEIWDDVNEELRTLGEET